MPEPKPLPPHLPALPQPVAVTPFHQLSDWWAPWQDDHIDVLLRSALQNNLDWKARLEEIRAGRSELSSVDRSYLPELHGVTETVLAPNGIDNFLQFGFDATWELDLYGRKASAQLQTRAALLRDTTLARATFFSLTAEVLRSYFLEQSLRQKSALLDQQHQILEQQQNMLKSQAGLGLIAPLYPTSIAHDLFQVEQQQLNTRQALSRNRWRLALLTGLSSEQIAAMPPLTRILPNMHLPSLPLQMLNQEPDVLQAQANLLEAAGQRGMAKAALFPSISLSVGYLYAENVTQNHIGLRGELNGTPTFGPNIDLPIFDFERRLKHLHARQHGLQAAVYEYQSAVIAAYRNTREDIDNFATALARLQLCQQQNSQLELVQQQQDKQVKLGLTAPTSQFASLLQSNENQQQIIQAQTQAALSWVALYKQLAWSSDSAHGDVLPALEDSHS